MEEMLISINDVKYKIYYEGYLNKQELKTYTRCFKCGFGFKKDFNKTDTEEKINNFIFMLVNALKLKNVSIEKVILQDVEIKI